MLANRSSQNLSDAELGWQLSNLRIIINTHIHIDHPGGNAEMLELSGGAIHVHRAEADYTDRERYLEKYCREALRLMGDADQIPQSEAFQRQLLGREWGIERQLDDGDSVDLGGDIRLEVVHTPGHTPGSASFYWESEGWLFSGDAINGRGGRAPRFPLYFDAVDYKNTLQRVRDMPVQTLAQAHRYRCSAATQEAIRTGDEVRQTLADSAAAWQAIDDAVSGELRAEPNIAFPELVRRVVRRAAPGLGNDADADGIPAGSVATIAAHARSLGHKL